MHKSQIIESFQNSEIVPITRPRSAGHRGHPDLKPRPPYSRRPTRTEKLTVIPPRDRNVNYDIMVKDGAGGSEARCRRHAMSVVAHKLVSVNSSSQAAGAGWRHIVSSIVTRTGNTDHGAGLVFGRRQWFGARSLSQGHRGPARSTWRLIDAGKRQRSGP
jgi:hypothetical protein